ncbi:MAG TPA: Nif3-like dinuclear metal center hexameric protein [Burkholderiales bacterium]|nr:Nif3-like dinuclear metal center hexameric protein [Burkholderiales bacterium]
MQRDELALYLEQLLNISQVRDYCPNGLQVEGRAEIERVITGVTASAALIEAASRDKADAILVHHGYFWKGEDQRLVGARKRRIEALLNAGLNLFAYHLPLDLHPQLGNNAQLAARLDLIEEGRIGDQNLVCHGRMAEPSTLAQFGERITARLGRAPLMIGEPAAPIRRLAWCTGGAQSYFDTALAAGVDAYLTGEISEQHVHLARESGVAFIAAGHHATERYGVQALGAHLVERFGLHHRFIDIDNPV